MNWPATALAALLSMVGCAAPCTLGQEPPFGLSPEDCRRIDEVLPDKAPAAPLKRRKLLIYDGNVGYGGHASIPHANYALVRMGEKTGAFDSEVSRDPAVFQREYLQQFDAICLNNTVGNLFADPGLRQNLLEFVLSGGGLLGIHGATVAFTDFPQGARETWPEFGRMLGARGASHLSQDERVVAKLDSPQHPLNRPFGERGFEHVSEFFRVGSPYSRDRVHVLFSIDTAKTELPAAGTQPGVERADGDYALAWTRNYGRGRVVYCTIGHSPQDFRDPKILQFYLGAAQFVMHDLNGTTLPSHRATPAVVAREEAGWRLSIPMWTFHQFTLLEGIEKARQLGLSYIGGLSFQKVSSDTAENFDCNLTDAQLQIIRLAMDDAGVRMPTCYYATIPADEEGCRRVFEFGRKMGIETFISEPPPETLDLIERFCDEYDINLAIHNHGPDQSPVYWRPEGVLKACQGRSSRIGACPDTGYWVRSGIDPVEGIRQLGDRIITIQAHDLHERSPAGHDVPWGTGSSDFVEVVRELSRQKVRPTVFDVEYSYDFHDNMSQIARCIEFFDRMHTSRE